MKTVFIFDVDGTLANPHEPIDSKFMHWMENWVQRKDVYLCTNNTYTNIVPRLGRKLVTGCKAVFTSGGNSIWMNEKEAKTSEWRPSSELVTMLTEIVKQSQFKIRSGANIEYRTGLISFSILGKNASKEERQRYIEWDKTTKERRKVVQQIKEQFSDLNAFVTGDTSIDICEKGHDKSQILKYFNNGEHITFVGNETHTLGNDRPLTEAMYNNSKIRYTIHSVKNWQETYDFLRKIA